ncbi:DUF2235 domain-containing protein [Granulicella arctica]|uniref:DUF2235 domain-containing protein n=1 Tax=Granulicella arctica TaxID=940613 RepID=UPI0021E0067D|nr:DUF2235 domain-containing protein [Granulicella arctica]
MSKKIILCADGTWNTPHGPLAVPNDTNVRKLYLMLNEDASQLKYYDSGVGTDGSAFEHFFGGTMGEGLFEKVQDGYAFLSYVWDPGDEIFIFGFSRGAYTARSLAGMIALFGVPTKNLDNRMVKRIFDVYRISDHDQRKAAKEPLVAEYGLTDVDVRMVGVWDTVGALGVPGHLFGNFDQAKYGFLDTTLSKCVQNAYHAISIDERRASFLPTLWTNPDGSPRANDAQLTQVWFPGVHCDVGGSYSDCGLSNITLRWMIDNARACGLVFDDKAVEASLAPKPFLPLSTAHDEWRLIPWGLPKHRTIPANAVLSNTVRLRLSGMATYKPGAMDMDIAKYAEALVIPPNEL